MRADFIATIQKKAAISAIPASALRGQRRAGVVRAARRYLETVKLKRFAVAKSQPFKRQLDAATTELCATLPRGARAWALGRKALNLFLRDALYNRYLADPFDLERAEPFFEIPLDSVIAKGLAARDTDSELPRWPGLKYLKPRASDQYQAFAESIAREMQIARVHLDAYLWTDR